MSSRTYRGGEPSVQNSQDRELWHIINNPTNMLVDETIRQKRTTTTKSNKINLDEKLQERSSSLLQAKRCFNNLNDIKLNSQRVAAIEPDDYYERHQNDTLNSNRGSSLQLNALNIDKNPQLRKKYDITNFAPKNYGLLNFNQENSQLTTALPTSTAKSLVQSSISVKEALQKMDNKLQQVSPSIRLNSAQEMIPVSNGADNSIIEGGEIRSDPPSPNFGMEAKDNARAKSNIEMAPQFTPVNNFTDTALTTDMQKQSTIKNQGVILATSNMVVAAEHVVPVIDKKQRLTPLEGVIQASFACDVQRGSGLGQPGQSVMKKEQKRFKSPYEQKLPLLHVKGEIKTNQSKQQQQLPQANQQSQNQRKATIINSYRSHSTAVQNSSLQIQKQSPRPEQHTKPINETENQSKVLHPTDSSNSVTQQPTDEIQASIKDNQPNEISMKKLQKSQNNSSENQMQVSRLYSPNNKTEQSNPSDPDSKSKPLYYKPSSIASPLISEPQASMSVLEGPSTNTLHKANISFQSGGGGHKEQLCHTPYKNQPNATQIQKVAMSNNMPSANTQNIGASKMQALNQSPSKSTKVAQTSSLLAISNTDQSEHQLSPMKTFMIERNAAKNNNLQGFSDYVSGPTGPLPVAKQRSDIEAHLAQRKMSNQQQRVTVDSWAQNAAANSITAFTNNTTTANNASNLISANVNQAHSRMLQTNKTRQVMRTHQLPNQKFMQKPSPHEQRNSNCIVAGMLTTFQQMSPSKKKQDLLTRPTLSNGSNINAASQNKGMPLNAATHALAQQESSYLKTMVTQAASNQQQQTQGVIGSVGQHSQYLALEKSIRPQLNKYNQTQQPKLVSNAPGQRSSYGGNIIGIQQQRQGGFQQSGNSQVNPFIIDTNSQPKQSPMLTTSQKVQKPLSEVRPINQSHKPQRSLLYELPKNEKQSTAKKQQPIPSINAATSNDPLSKALHFQQLGEYCVMTAFPAANLGNPVAMKGQKSLSRLKRATDLITRAPEKQPTHLRQSVNQTSNLPNSILDQEEPLLISSATTAAVSASVCKGKSNNANNNGASPTTRKSMDKMTGNLQRVLPSFNPVQAQAQSTASVTGQVQQTKTVAPALGIDKELLFTMIGKTAPYSPRKSRKTSQQTQLSQSSSVHNNNNMNNGTTVKTQQNLQSDSQNKFQEANKTTQPVNQANFNENPTTITSKTRDQAPNQEVQIASGVQKLKSKMDVDQDCPTIVTQEDQEGMMSSQVATNPVAGKVDLKENCTETSEEKKMHSDAEKKTEILTDTFQPRKRSQQMVIKETLDADDDDQNSGKETSQRYKETQQVDQDNDQQWLKQSQLLGDQVQKSTRNKLFKNNAKTQKMNTNSSDGAEVNQDEISGPLSINHSEDNLNIISATVDGRVSEHNAQSSTGEDPTVVNFRRQTQKATTNYKNKSHFAGNFQGQNRGRRKRKQTTRSIIQSKPSLHSNKSRGHYPQHSEQQAAEPLIQSVQPMSGGDKASQAVPAVHNLTNKKFVKDTHRIDLYYQSKNGAPSQNQNDCEESYNPVPIALTGAKASEKGGTPQQSQSNGSRYQKHRTAAHKQRKDSTQFGQHSSHLSSTKSQPKILIKKHSRCSQRSSSAIRSPQLLNNVASSSTTKENNNGAFSSFGKGSKHHNQHQQQPYMFTNQDCAISQKSRPRTVTKAVSVASMGATSSISRCNIISGKSESKGPIVNKASIAQGADSPSPGKHLKFNAEFQSQASIVDIAEDKGQEQGSQLQATLKTPLKSLTGQNPVNQLQSKQQIESQRIQPQQQYILNRKETTSNDKNLTAFQASQVKRVRQIQSSQKTLEIRTKDNLPQTLIIQAKAQAKEPQSAAKTQDRKSKLLTAFSVMQRCDSEQVSQTLRANMNQAKIETTQNHNHNDQAGGQQEEAADSAAQSKQSMIDEEIGEECGSHGGLMTPAAKNQGYQRPPPLTFTKPKPEAEVSPYCTINMKTEQKILATNSSNFEGQMAQTQQIQDERMVTTLVPKPGSSMKNQQAARSYQQDEDYVPSAQNQPYCSCKSFVVMDSADKKVLQSKNRDEVREMASLTKMMTTIVTLDLAQEMRLDIRSTYFKVSAKAAATIGTTSNLLEGQVLSIWDLLHGLMLPSGNDAAMVLAENFSAILCKQGNRINRGETNKQAAEEQPLQTPNNGVSAFVKIMNKTARKLHCRCTEYTNPHGLADKANHSTAHEQCLIAYHGMKSEIFRQIVNTKTFTSINFVPLKRCKKLPNYDFTTWQTYDERDVPFAHGGIEYVMYYQTWYNSNKLLDHPGFCGVKTGQTSTAGCCLAIYYKSNAINKNLITVVLGSKSIEYRWKDTRRLTLWVDAILQDEQDKRTESPAKAISKRVALSKGVRPMM